MVRNETTSQMPTTKVTCGDCGEAKPKEMTAAVVVSAQLVVVSRRVLQRSDRPKADLREPLAALVSELARLLSERGEDALRLWPETVRAHGVRRYDQHFDADDVAREFKVLHKVLLAVYFRRYGSIEGEVAEML